MFHKEFVSTGLIDLKFGKLYDMLLAKRFEADYENFAMIDENEVPEYLQEVKKFLGTAKEILGNK